VISCALAAGVKACRGLVQEERARLSQQLDRDTGSLTLATAERPDSNLSFVRSTQPCRSQPATASWISAAVVDDGSRSRAA